ncbi:hypothetical protein GIB67_032864 [Kingdonia uniflora]|uniref:OBG-type G domain-containing protein n=1 Tax=Kingdonia uniflora TaxID=39325 RepID=A0A7J7NBV0_9MAGN|nr:hypothetical protein GIB67_032864 [Kingdonia uniflora]
MATVMQKIKDIEDEMARTQKNKATAHHLGLLKAKLAKLRRDLLAPPSKGGGGGAGEGFDVTKSGDSRVGLVGFPSVGKSTLLNKLTGTFSEVASYEFTTLTCIPGVIVYRGAKIQLLDLPGIIEGAKDGKGRGRQVISTARTCNCIIIVLDAIKPITHKRLIEKELEGFGIRLNKEPPNLSFRKKEKGGINFTSTVTNTHLDLETVKAICGEYRIHNADISLRYDATADDLIDVIEGSRVYIPCIYAVNKIDQITLEELEILDKLPHYCPVSAHLEWNLEGLLEKIWEYLDLTRIYTKPKGMNPDYEDPVILSSKIKTVEDFCIRIHKDMLKQFKYALVWGSSAKHKPQRVGKGARGSRAYDSKSYIGYDSFEGRQMEIEWCKPFRRKIGRVLWDLTPYAIGWFLWKEMNDRHFKDTMKTVEAIILDVHMTILYWSSSSTIMKGVRVEDLVT